MLFARLRKPFQHRLQMRALLSHVLTEGGFPRFMPLTANCDGNEIL